MNKHVAVLQYTFNVIAAVLMLVLCMVILDMYNCIQQSKKEVAGLPSRHRVSRRGLPSLNGMGVK